MNRDLASSGKELHSVIGKELEHLKHIKCLDHIERRQVLALARLAHNEGGAVVVGK